jgi:hypothetical protein
MRAVWLGQVERALLGPAGAVFVAGRVPGDRLQQERRIPLRYPVTDRAGLLQCRNERAGGSVRNVRFRWLKRQFGRRDANLDDKVLVRSFVGGMRYDSVLPANSGPGTVKLCIYRSGLELRSTVPMGFLGPRWRARYDEIAAVHWLGRADSDSSIISALTSQRGVMFTTLDGRWAIFWAFNRNQVLDTLRWCGLRIEAESKRAGLFGPGV